MQQKKLVVICLLLVVLAMAFVFQHRRMGDWDRLCQVLTTSLEARPSANPAERATDAVKALKNAGPWSTQILQALQTVSVADPAQRYKLLQQAAAQDGFSDWNCPAVPKLYGP